MTTGNIKELGVVWLTGTDQPSYESLNQEEQDLFDIGFGQISSQVDYLNSAPLSNILKDFKQDYNIFIQTAKYALKQQFGGTLLASGFLMQLIRAASILTPSGASTPTYDWTTNTTDVGWAKLFGTFSSPISFNTTNSNLALGNTYNNVTMLATHLIDTVPPLYDEIQIKVAGTTYEVYPTRFQVLERVYVTRLPSPLFVKLNGQFAIEANYRRLGQSNPQLLGIQAAPYAYAAQQ